MTHSPTLLPLVEGLSVCKNPTALVRTAIEHWEALQTLRRGLRRWRQHRADRQPARKRRRTQQNDRQASDNSPPSSSKITTTCHWLWRTLWESSSVAERRAAAKIIAHALTDLSEQDQVWKFRLLRVCTEYHAAGIVHPTDPRITSEVVQLLWTCLQHQNVAVSWASFRAFRLGELLAQAVWEAGEIPALTNGLGHFVWQTMVETQQSDAVRWYQAMRARTLWRAPKRGPQDAWTPLAYLIAAHVRTTTMSKKIATEDLIGVPVDIWHRVTDPWQGRIQVVSPPAAEQPSPPAVGRPQDGGQQNLHHSLSSHEDEEADDDNDDEAFLVSGHRHRQVHQQNDEEQAEDRPERESGDGIILGELDEDDEENEDDDDEESDVDEDEDDEMDGEDAMEIDLDEYTAIRAVTNTVRHNVSTLTSNHAHDGQDADANSVNIIPPILERRKAFLLASLQVASSLYPVLPARVRRKDFLDTSGENTLWEGMSRAILPPKAPTPDIKVILRRAPTQEEFFRGNLSTNPVDLELLRQTRGHVAADDDYEPTVGDLRQHIANDLQMGDSAELIEILIANKIVGTNIKLRLIQQVVWRQHLMENSTTTRDGGQSFVSMGSGISMIFSSSRPGRGHQAITADTPTSQLPPMIAVYRLAGVDGEATEDTVDEVVDPEAPDEAATPEAREAQIQKEFGLTCLVGEGRGFYVLLRSIQFTVEDELRKIRRDQVDLGPREKNLARESFQKSAPCQGLVLLRHCVKVASNRTKLLRARAPTVLLTLLLEVLKSLSTAGSEHHTSNPTTDILQELIEQLTSDISIVASSSNEDVEEGLSLLETQDASSMPLLLEAIEKISLKSNLRGVISKLLPFLTYGQSDLSRSLAQHFTEHIDMAELAKCEDENSHSDSMVLMKTFVETLISLPANGVCNALRAELIHCKFIDRVAEYVLKNMPSQPPSWSPALWTKKDVQLISESGAKKNALDDGWRSYYNRRGTRTALQMLAGLAKKHKSTQARIATFGSFVQSLHWLEATSDKSILVIETNGVGLLAETLLDEMMEENAEVTRLVEEVRKKTKLRKRELAQERRAKTLGKMNSFGALSVGSGGSAGSSDRGTAASRLDSAILGSVADFFGSPQGATTSASSTSTRALKTKGSAKKSVPVWMAEMEKMEEESGIICAVCQEGRSLQPYSLLGLYVYVTKVAIPLDHCGARPNLDGSMLLKSLPSCLPRSLASNKQVQEWFSVGKAAASGHSTSSSYCTSVGGKRSSLYTTTVTSGNAIHVSCHQKAKQADRNHPKAPKTEWEGAKLRNGRVSCNAILPLVSSRSSKVPLMAVDSALSDHQTAVSNVLGASVKNPLWTTLFDARFLLLRFAYGEALNLDSGGGSLSSNAALLFHHLTMAEMFEKNAQLDSPELSQHARGLSAAFLSACAIVTTCTGVSSNLIKYVADSAPMAILTCILLHNQHDDSGESGEESNGEPHPNRRWILGREYFLKGLLICAGRRKAVGARDSGCLTTRNVGKRLRSSSFADWDEEEPEQSTMSQEKMQTVEDYSKVLRPMLTLFAIFDSLSSHYHGQMDDSQIQSAADSLASAVEACLRCQNIHELIQHAGVTLSGEELVRLLQSGMITTP